MARGSLIKLQNQLFVAKDVNYLANEDFTKVANQSIIVHKLLNALMKKNRES